MSCMAKGCLSTYTKRTSFNFTFGFKVMDVEIRSDLELCEEHTEIAKNQLQKNEAEARISFPASRSRRFLWFSNVFKESA